MESFKDFETDIMWFKDDESIESYDNLDEVNSWDNDSIRKFITLGYEYAGDVLKKGVGQKTGGSATQRCIELPPCGSLEVNVQV